MPTKFTCDEAMTSINYLLATALEAPTPHKQHQQCIKDGKILFEYFEELKKKEKPVIPPAGKKLVTTKKKAQKRGRRKRG